MASCAPDYYHVAGRLQEITQCSAKQAEKLLTDSNNDLMLAVEMFFAGDTSCDQRDYPTGESSHRGRMTTDVNMNNIKARKHRYPQAVPAVSVDGSQGKGDYIITTRPKLKKKSAKFSADNKISFQDIDAEEDIVQEVVAVSLFEIYPDLDLNYLRSLAKQYKGRQEELEEYLQSEKFSQPKRDQDNFSRPKQVPDKFSQLRHDLKTYLQELKKANVEGVELMVLEDCPICSAPQIVPDKRARLFQCSEGCSGEFCRECKVYHEPVTCQRWRDGVPQGNQSYRVTKLKPGGLYNLGFKYQMVEGEFFRMMSREGVNLKILSIDMVENKKLEDKFELKKQQFRAEGLVDAPVLLFHAKDQVDVEKVLENNFQLSIVNTGYVHTIGVHLTEWPKVDMSTKKQGCLIMCLVLEGHDMSRVHDRSSIIVPNVDQILPKYVVHFTDGDAVAASIKQSRKESFGSNNLDDQVEPWVPRLGGNFPPSHRQYQADSDIETPQYNLLPILTPRVGRGGDPFQTSSAEENK